MKLSHALPLPELMLRPFTALIVAPYMFISE